MNWRNKLAPLHMLVIAVGCCLGCTPPEAETIQIAGSAKGFEAKIIYLLEVKDGEMKRMLLDSNMISSNGDYVLSAIPSKGAFWQVEIASGPSVLLVGDAYKINLDLSRNVLPNYRVSGSAASQELADFYRNTQKQIDVWQQQQENFLASQSFPDSVRQVLQSNYSRDSINFLVAIEKNVGDINNPLVRQYAFGIASLYLPQARLQTLANQLKLESIDSSTIKDSKDSG